MTTEEAMQLIEQATGAVTADRATHVKITEALEVIRAALVSPDTAGQ